MHADRSYNHDDAFVQRRKEYGAYLDMINMAVNSHTHWIIFRETERRLDSSYATMVSFKQHVDDIGKLAVVEQSQPDLHRKSNQKKRAKKEQKQELDAIELIAQACFGSLLYPGGRISNHSDDAPTA